MAWEASRNAAHAASPRNLLVTGAWRHAPHWARVGTPRTGSHLLSAVLAHVLARLASKTRRRASPSVGVPCPSSPRLASAAPVSGLGLNLVDEEGLDGVAGRRVLRLGVRHHLHRHLQVRLPALHSRHRSKRAPQHVLHLTDGAVHKADGTSPKVDGTARRLSRSCTLGIDEDEAHAYELRMAARPQSSIACDCHTRGRTLASTKMWQIPSACPSTCPAHHAPPQPHSTRLLSLTDIPLLHCAYTARPAHKSIQKTA